MQNNHRSPVPEVLTLTSPFRFLFRDWRRSVGIGTLPATNLASAHGDNPDPSRRDPSQSKFWSPRSNIAGQDLYAGFGREQPTMLAEGLCFYAGPKTSCGTRAGCDLECEGTRYQVKFGEVNSQPFTARIFHALGYHVDPTDSAPSINVRDDRRLAREFNLRR